MVKKILVIVVIIFLFLPGTSKRLHADYSNVCCTESNTGNNPPKEGDACSYLPAGATSPVPGTCRILDSVAEKTGNCATSRGGSGLVCDDQVNCCSRTDSNEYCHQKDGFISSCTIPTDTTVCSTGFECFYEPNPGTYSCIFSGGVGTVVDATGCSSGYEPNCAECSKNVTTTPTQCSTPGVPCSLSCTTVKNGFTDDPCKCNYDCADGYICNQQGTCQANCETGLGGSCKSICSGGETNEGNNFCENKSLNCCVPAGKSCQGLITGRTGICVQGFLCPKGYTTDGLNPAPLGKETRCEFNLLELKAERCCVPMYNFSCTGHITGLSGKCYLVDCPEGTIWSGSNPPFSDMGCPDLYSCCVSVTIPKENFPELSQICIINGKFGINTAVGCMGITDTTSFLSFVLPWAVGVGGGTAFILMVVAGYLIMTSAGDPGKAKAGRELLTSAIVGLLMIIFSVLILDIIGIRILRIPGL